MITDNYAMILIFEKNAAWEERRLRPGVSENSNKGGGW